MTEKFRFFVDYTSTECLGRVGRLITRHGEIKTPVFMPVGTQGTVKTLSPAELEEAGAEIILANAYHLFLQPGREVLEKFGGLHRFMGWNRPILTDSGGFQVFSLKGLNKVTSDGVKFASHLDGKKLFLTPEDSIAIQRSINSDIMMVFDECCPYPVDEIKARVAMERSLDWAIRCRKVHPKLENGQALFGIVQGSTYLDLRKECLDRLLQYDFEGLAIGGLSVGEPKEEMLHVLDYIMPFMPNDKPRYLMGVGTPEDLFFGVERGIDMFDCVFPTRVARHGAVFTPNGRIDLTALPWKYSEIPIDESCSCYACRNFSRAYLRHLFKAKELLALRLASLHNITFIVTLMSKIRKALCEGKFLKFKTEFLESYKKTASKNN